MKKMRLTILFVVYLSLISNFVYSHKTSANRILEETVIFKWRTLKLESLLQGAINSV